MVSFSWNMVVPLSETAYSVFFVEDSEGNTIYSEGLGQVPQVVPLPPGALLMASGLLGLLALARRRRR